VNLYNAFIVATTLKALRRGSHSFTCILAAFLQTNKLSTGLSLERAAKVGIILQFKDDFCNVYSFCAVALMPVTLEFQSQHARTATSVTHERKSQLVFLAFEKNIIRQVHLTTFVTEFNTVAAHAALFCSLPSNVQTRLTRHLMVLNDMLQHCINYFNF